MKLALVIPYFNEEKLIIDCLDSVINQSDKDFLLILVNNVSTDNSERLVQDFFKSRPDVNHLLVNEPQKGTGSAADTGFRSAISQGADYIARTDSDSTLDQNYIKNAKELILKLDPDVLMGLTLPSQLDHPTKIETFFFSYFPILAEKLTSFLPSSLKQYHLRGNNMVIKSTVYEAAGGFPRVPLEQKIDDQALLMALKKHDDTKFHRSNDLVVYSSLRRDRAYTILSMWLWYQGISKNQKDIR